jgi:molybdopterin synthase sulfur carrier subunit
MPVKVRIPTPLRTLTNGVDIVELQGGTVGGVLNELSGKFAGMDKRLFKQPGELNRFVNVYVNDEDIRFLENLETPIKDGDDVSIVPAIAGG